MDLGQHVYWVAPMVAGSIAGAYYLGYNQGQKDLSLKETALAECVARSDYVDAIKSLRLDDTLASIRDISKNIKGAKDLISANETQTKQLEVERTEHAKAQAALDQCAAERTQLSASVSNLKGDMEEAKTLLFDKIERDETFMLQTNQTYAVEETGLLIGLVAVNANDVTLSINGDKETLGSGMSKSIKSPLFGCRLHVQQFWPSQAQASFKIACSTRQAQ